jgi:hypothetical protein
LGEPDDDGFEDDIEVIDESRVGEVRAQLYRAIPSASLA